jgi:hypothetical protein
VKTQWLFNKILDPTVAGACVRRGPRRELGSRVQGGPPLKREGVCDLSRPRKIQGLWSRAGEGDGEHAGVRWHAAESSPARLKIVLWVTVSCASGLYTALSNMRTPPGVQGDGAGTHGGRHRKGADRPRRRARGAA